MNGKTVANTTLLRRIDIAQIDDALQKMTDSLNQNPSYMKPSEFKIKENIQTLSAKVQTIFARAPPENDLPRLCSDPEYLLPDSLRNKHQIFQEMAIPLKIVKIAITHGSVVQRSLREE